MIAGLIIFPPMIVQMLTDRCFDDKCFDHLRSDDCQSTLMNIGSVVSWVCKLGYVIITWEVRSVNFYLSCKTTTYGQLYNMVAHQ